MSWNFQIQYSDLHSNVIMCIATLLIRWRKRESANILMLFQPRNWYLENYSIVQSQTRNIKQLHYNCYFCTDSCAYHHWSCEFESSSWRGVLDITICHKVYPWLSAGRWFSSVSSANKTDRQDIIEILLKVALNIIPLILLSLQVYLFTYIILYVFIFPICLC
jgi:hypothetical protein